MPREDTRADANTATLARNFQSSDQTRRFQRIAVDPHGRRLIRLQAHRGLPRQGRGMDQRESGNRDRADTDISRHLAWNHRGVVQVIGSAHRPDAHVVRSTARGRPSKAAFSILKNASAPRRHHGPPSPPFEGRKIQTPEERYPLCIARRHDLPKGHPKAA